MNRLFGHDEAVRTFRAGLEGGRLHHAWLIVGPKGVGKATFARAAARRMLAGDPSAVLAGLEVEPDDPGARLFEAGSHPDFHLVEREVWERGEVVPRDERTGKDALGRSIRIAQVRSVNARLAQTTALGARRVVLIDAIDDLEPGGANALLKSLEEPPASTTFLLVSHVPGRLLATIRSRCRRLSLAPLDRDAMTSALRQQLPGAPAEEIEVLAEIGGGAPGAALAFQGLDMAELESALTMITNQGDPTNARRSALSHSLSLKAAQPRYEAFLARVPAVIADAAKSRRGHALEDAIALWERASALAVSARRHSLDSAAVVFELGGLLAALAPARGL